MPKKGEPQSELQVLAWGIDEILCCVCERRAQVIQQDHENKQLVYRVRCHGQEATVRLDHSLLMRSRQTMVGLQVLVFDKRP